MLGHASNRELDTCHPKLQRLYREVDRRLSKRKLLDLTILCGHRGEAAQNKAFDGGQSKKRWPDSKHNTLPSTATDAAPYPIDWNDKLRFGVLAGYIMAVADDLDIEINVGALWKSFPDAPHVELTAYELSRP